MSPISPTSQSNSVPISEASSASIHNISNEEAIENLSSVLPFLSLNKSRFNLLSTASLVNIVSFLHPITSPNSPIEIVNIINRIKHLGKETPGNGGFFKIENDGTVFCPRFEAYFKLDHQMSIYKYLEEVWALKQAEKPEEKKAAFSLDQVEKLKTKDFSSLDKEHKRSTEVSCITNIDSLYGKKLSTNETTRLFPLKIFRILAKNLDIQFLSLNSKIIHLPYKIGSLPHLKYLNLSCNELESLPNEIGKLNKLKHLELHNNKLKSLPDQISRLNKLKHLDLRNNKLKSLPKSFANLPKLAWLDLSKNSLRSLPTLTKFKGIGWLNLSHNRFSALPEDFWRLYDLRDLDLSHNLFESFPNEVGSLPELRNLDLSFNKITSFPKEGSFYSKLTKLNLSNNGLESLPSFLNNSRRLEELDLSSNKLKCLGTETKRLNLVEILNLNQNKLTSLPKEFKEFLYLRALFLRGNKISSVENIPVTKSFSFCDLSNNRLTSLTDEFLKNSGLKSLYLTENRNLTSLPEKIKDLQHLKNLHLSKWQKVPESLSSEAHSRNLLIQYEDCKEEKKVSVS